MKNTCLKLICILLTAANFSTSAIAMEEQFNNIPTLSLDMLTLSEAPAVITQEEQEALDTSLYAACKGADPIAEGQLRVVDISLVRKLLTDGASVNMKGAHDNSPLHVACRYGLKDLVVELLTRNPEIDALNAFSMTALYFASGQGFDDIAHLLLVKNANTECADLNGITALHAAVIENRLGAATLLIGAGAIVNAPNNTGALPIHTVFLSEPVNLDLATLLIRNKADLGAADKQGLTSLKIAFTSKNIDLHLLIINADVNEDVRRAFEPFFLNAMFCVNKDIRIIRALLAKGMNKNIVLQNNWTPLHFACGMGCMDIAEYLIREGADLQAESIPDNKGIIRTPLDCITKRGHTMYLLGVINELLGM